MSGAQRLSLAFAAFPEIFDAAHPGPWQRLIYGLIHLLDPLIKLESLYRYPYKFHSLADRRYVVLCAHHIPIALAVRLSLEFVRRPYRVRGPSGASDTPKQCHQRGPMTRRWGPRTLASVAHMPEGRSRRQAGEWHGPNDGGH